MPPPEDAAGDDAGDGDDAPADDNGDDPKPNTAE